LVPKGRRISNKFCQISFAHCNNTRFLCALHQGSGQTVGSKQTHFVGARRSAVIGWQHSSRISFSIDSDIKSNVIDIYFLVWSLSRLLCRFWLQRSRGTRYKHTHVAEVINCSLIVFGLPPGQWRVKWAKRFWKPHWDILTKASNKHICVLTVCLRLVACQIACCVMLAF